MEVIKQEPMEEDKPVEESVGDIPKRICLPPQKTESEGDLDSKLLVELWAEQDKYIDHLEAQLASLGAVKKSSSASQDASRREHLLVVRLATKEQELQELSNQISELKAAQAPSMAAMRNALLDPAVNIIVQSLKKELVAAKNKLQETQEELSAWKFTPDSVTGKRLMAKCRQLLQENEDIGKMISSGRLAKLEGELAMQKTLCEEMKKNQVEMDDFVQELDEDVEGMQSTIYFLQQQLKDAKETIANLEAHKKANPIVVVEPPPPKKEEEKQEEPEEPPNKNNEDDDNNSDDDKESSEEKGDEEDQESVGRGSSRRRGTPTKTESPRRGRSALQQQQQKGHKRDQTESGDDDQGSRPKRRRAAPQRFVDEEGKRKKATSESEPGEESKEEEQQQDQDQA